MNRMKTYAGTALAALFLFSAAACSSSGDSADDGAADAGMTSTSAASADKSRLGSMSPLPGRSTVSMYSSWSTGAAYGFKKVGSEEISPGAVTVTCTGTGDSLAISAKFPDSEFTARRNDQKMTFQFPGMREISVVPEKTVSWEGNGIGYEKLTMSSSTTLTGYLEDPSQQMGIRAFFEIACPLA